MCRIFKNLISSCFFHQYSNQMLQWTSYSLVESSPLKYAIKSYVGQGLQQKLIVKKLIQEYLHTVRQGNSECFLSSMAACAAFPSKKSLETLRISQKEFLEDNSCDCRPFNSRNYHELIGTTFPIVISNGLEYCTRAVCKII